jgi:protein-disulfide isomerase-like protein with CxxC motif
MAKNNIFVDCQGTFEESQFWNSWDAASFPSFVTEWQNTWSKANSSGTLPRFEDHYPALKVMVLLSFYRPLIKEGLGQGE